jgi:hypothetical protein
MRLTVFAKDRDIGIPINVHSLNSWRLILVSCDIAMLKECLNSLVELGISLTAVDHQAVTCNCHPCPLPVPPSRTFFVDNLVLPKGCYLNSGRPAEALAAYNDLLKAVS